MKMRILWRKVYDYVRYDLKEIAFPSSLPNPPGYIPPRKLTWEERWGKVKRGARLYRDSWRRDIGPDLRPEYYRKLKETQDKQKEEKDSSPDMDSPTFEELAEAARGGMEKLRPALQKVYMIRASAYSDALKAFIKGYQEGIQEVMLKKEKAESELKDGAPKI